MLVYIIANMLINTPIRVVWATSPRNAIWMFKFYEYVRDIYWIYDDASDRHSLRDFIDFFLAVSVFVLSSALVFPILTYYTYVYIYTYASSYMCIYIKTVYFL